MCAHSALRAAFFISEKGDAMRVNGRTIRYSTLAERRLMLSLGIDSLHVPRKLNPYSVARRLRRIASGQSRDLLFVRELIARQKGKNGHWYGSPPPEGDTPEMPSHDDGAVL